jgi:hypothetical protein
MQRNPAISTYELNAKPVLKRWLAGSASDSRLGPVADKAAEKVAAMAIVEIWRLSSNVFTSVGLLASEQRMSPAETSI